MWRSRREASAKNSPALDDSLYIDETRIARSEQIFALVAQRISHLVTSPRIDRHSIKNPEVPTLTFFPETSFPPPST